MIFPGFTFVFFWLIILNCCKLHFYTQIKFHLEKGFYIMNKTRNTCLLILAAFIWGVAFVAQSVGMDYVGPWTFLASRSIIGALFLIPVILFLDKKKSKEELAAPKDQKALIVGGLCCGLALTEQVFSSSMVSSIQRLEKPDLLPPSTSCLFLSLVSFLNANHVSSYGSVFSLPSSVSTSYV